MSGLRRVILGLSGGVDSSVAAYLLQRQGYAVTCVFMRNWDRNDEAGSGLAHSPCPIEADYGSAKDVCSHLGLPPLEVVDFTKEYWTGVFTEWVEGYRVGLTPNPDAACNRVIKFGAFRDFALGELKGDAFATGHYAQVVAVHPSTPPLLLTAVDPSKDQSDFLAMVPPSALHHCLLPLGGHLKSSVRALAASIGLPTAGRPDSVGMCFVGDPRGRRGANAAAHSAAGAAGGTAGAAGVKGEGGGGSGGLSAFLSNYLPPHPGEVRSVVTREYLGHTPAANALTPGQGVRIGGLKAPHFVVSNGMWEHHQGLERQQRQQQQHKPPHKVVVWAVPGASHPALLSTSLAVDFEGINWSVGCEGGGGGSPPQGVKDAVREAVARRGGDLQGRGGTSTSQQHLDVLLKWVVNSSGASSGTATTTTTTTTLYPTSTPVRYRERHRVSNGGGGNLPQLDPLGRVTVMWASEFLWVCRALTAPKQSQISSEERGVEEGEGIEAVKGESGWMEEEPITSPPTLTPSWHRAGSTSGGGGDDRLLLVLVSSEGVPIRAPAPGQVLVLYEPFPNESITSSDGLRGGATHPLPLGAVDGEGGGKRGVWRGGGLTLLGGAPILCTGPTLWEMQQAGKVPYCTL